MNETNEVPTEDIQEETEALSEYFGTAQEMVIKYLRCSACGSHLHFTHVTDFGRNLTQESARCPECGIRGKKLVHRLQ